MWWCEDYLNRKTAHFRLTSVAQKRCMLKLTIDKFVIGRDQAYFKLAFFSGDRPGDLGQVKVPEILRFPNDDGFLFNHILGCS